MNKAGERLYNGVVKENPTFVLMLGMCPTLAVTTSAINGLGMGLATMVVLALSNLFISLLRKVIPNRVRIPAFIVIIASFVTIVQLLLEAYRPSLNQALGVYIPLIVVNCIILGRAEAYAYTNPPIASLFDGIGMGLGFSFALTCIGAVRELLGAGKLFGYAVMPDSYVPIRIFSQAPGAFFVLAALVALQNVIKEKRKKAGKPYEKIGSGCSQDCMSCSDKGCARRFYDAEGESGKAGTMRAAAKAPENKTLSAEPAGQKPAGQKPAEQKLSGQKPAGQKTAEQKLSGQKPAGQKPAEQKLSEQKTAEQKSSELRARAVSILKADGEAEKVNPEEEEK